MAIEPSGHDARATRATAALLGIADALGTSVGEMLADPRPDELAELMVLWRRIADAAARRSILDEVRRLAGRA